MRVLQQPTTLIYHEVNNSLDVEPFYYTCLRRWLQTIFIPSEKRCQDVRDSESILYATYRRRSSRLIGRYRFPTAEKVRGLGPESMSRGMLWTASSTKWTGITTHQPTTTAVWDLSSWVRLIHRCYRPKSQSAHCKPLDRGTTCRLVTRWRSWPWTSQLPVPVSRLQVRLRYVG